MNFSERNRKVAIARWKNIHSQVRLNYGFSKEKTAIHSYLCGDGDISVREKKRMHEIRFSLDDLNLAERVVSLFKTEFNISPKIKKIKSKIPNGKGYFLVRICNKPVCLHLLSLGKYRSLTWVVPNELNEEMKKEWIKCFFDCEAHVNIRNRQIQLKSVNKEGLFQLKSLLEEQGIFPKLYGPYKQKGENHNPYYFLIILGKGNIQNYFQKINFYHTDKIISLSNLVKAVNL